MNLKMARRVWMVAGLALSLAVVGCGSSATPSSGSTERAQPSNAATVAPSPSVSTATLEVAPSPTTTKSLDPSDPASLQVTLTSFTADVQAGGAAFDKYKPISLADLTTAYKAFAGDPGVVANGNILLRSDVFSQCTDSTQDNQTRQPLCAAGLGFAFRGEDKLPGNTAVLAYTTAMARYVVHSGLNGNAADWRAFFNIMTPVINRAH